MIAVLPATALLIASCAGPVPVFRPPTPSSTPSAATLPVFKAVAADGTVMWSGVRPAVIGLSADGGNVITSIRWASWTTTIAVGYGTRGVQNCKPDCAEGATVETRTRVTLSDPVNGVFTVMVEDTPGDVQEWSYPQAWALDAEPEGYQPAATHMSTASPSPSTAGSAWAVISEYYGDIETGDYRAAWDMLGFDPGGQPFRTWKEGYACTGPQTLTEESQTGSTVAFSLTATNICDGNARQKYSGTATVTNGEITASTVTQLSGPRTG